jgi:putative transposase
LRTSNLIERAIQQELKRRTIKIRVFPNEEALERRVSAVLAQIDDDGPST